MGSVNQVCLLTRAPITNGDAVVVWQEIKGPWFDNGSGKKNGLLFGLPQRASYNDYGGAENYVDKPLFELHEQAWTQQDLYRLHQVKSRFSVYTLAIAASAETMHASHKIAPLLYGQEELNPLDVFENGYDDAFMNKRNRADARAKEILRTIGQRIGQADLPTDEPACKAACFNIVQDEVGPLLAWAVWDIISNGELFAQRELCMMRAEAYDYVVQTVSKDTVAPSLQPSSKVKYRQSLAQHWLAWEEKRSSIASTNPLLVQMRLRNERLMPLARPWGIEEKPIESFFWNALPYETLMNTVGKDPFLDAMTFTKGWHYLRSNLCSEEGSGQHADWKLHADMMKSVHAKVRETGPLKRDWDSYI